MLGCGPLHDLMLVMVHLFNASVSMKVSQEENLRKTILNKNEKNDASKKFKESLQEQFWQRQQLRISYATPRGGNTNIGMTVH